MWTSSVFSNPERACYSPGHGDAPGATPAAGEREMLIAVRRSMDPVDPQAALYIEEMPPDFNAQSVDGAFCYALNSADGALSPGKINLYRFLFPQLKLFDMVSAGINPTAMTAADMKLSFLNSHDLWLKGDINSRYSPEVRAFITKAHRALREHAEAFTSDAVEPLVPTAAPENLANRFLSTHDTVFTLYNRGFKTFHGRVLEIPPEQKGRRFVNLFDGRPVAITPQGEHSFLELELPPRDVGAVAAVVSE